MDFDCDFDAPMFVDFQNLDGDHQERQQAEAYFEVDHETDIENPADVEKNTDASNANPVECDTAVNQEKNWEPKIPTIGDVGNNDEQIPTKTVIRGEKSKSQGMEDMDNKSCPTDNYSQVSTIAIYGSVLVMTARSPSLNAYGRLSQYLFDKHCIFYSIGFKYQHFSKSRWH